MPASARASREQRPGERVGLDVHHHDVLAVLAAARAHGAMPAAGLPVASITTSVRRRARSPPSASSVTKVVPCCAASSSERARVALGRPAHAGERGARAVGREVGDGEDVHARRAPRLRQVHRAEFAGADEHDAHGRPCGRHGRSSRRWRFIPGVALQVQWGRAVGDGRASSLPSAGRKMRRMSHQRSRGGIRRLRGAARRARAGPRSPGAACVRPRPRTCGIAMRTPRTSAIAGMRRRPTSSAAPLDELFPQRPDDDRREVRAPRARGRGRDLQPRTRIGARRRACGCARTTSRCATSGARRAACSWCWSTSSSSRTPRRRSRARAPALAQAAAARGRQHRRPDELHRPRPALPLRQPAGRRLARGRTPRKRSASAVDEMFDAATHASVMPRGAPRARGRKRTYERLAHGDGADRAGSACTSCPTWQPAGEVQGFYMPHARRRRGPPHARRAGAPGARALRYFAENIPGPIAIVDRDSATSS